MDGEMVYGSSFVDEEGIAKACGCPLLPLKSHIKGPALVSVQEHLLHKCGFRKARGCRTLAEGTKAIINLSLEQVSVPGGSGFPLPCWGGDLQ
ncbi:actin-related protein 2/3 complex subunit 3-like isoform X2 [Coffea arabica]|uniref:Actin-related protein 2/3 complex subunit 3-like isoform X2 n=1 Tax=Coffea arabica TaxID=13443 RepID=A0ABM4UMX4_COFAR